MLQNDYNVDAFGFRVVGEKHTEIKFKRLSDDAQIPIRAHYNDSGLDLYAVKSYMIWPHETLLVGTGIACQLPVGTTGQVTSRSSIAKQGILVHLGTLDEGYRGEISAIVTNLNDHKVWINIGDRIAQLVVLNVERPAVIVAEELEESTRGEKGYGSSGV